MIVYFDTEFTDLTDAFGPIKLISAGFVAEDGRELYFDPVSFDANLVEA